MQQSMQTPQRLEIPTEIGLFLKNPTEAYRNMAPFSKKPHKIEPPSRLISRLVFNRSLQKWGSFCTIGLSCHKIPTKKRAPI